VNVRRERLATIEGSVPIVGDLVGCRFAPRCAARSEACIAMPAALEALSATTRWLCVGPWPRSDVMKQRSPARSHRGTRPDQTLPGRSGAFRHGAQDQRARGPTHRSLESARARRWASSRIGCASRRRGGCSLRLIEPTAGAILHEAPT